MLINRRPSADLAFSFPSSNMTSAATTAATATGTGTFDFVFAQDIPSVDLKLLSGGQDLGAVEIVTFFPHWLRNGDVARRLLMNGSTQAHFVNVLSSHCHLARGNMNPNTVLKWLQEGMRKITGNPNWARRKHLVHMSRTNCNPNNLTLLGCRLNIEHQPRRCAKRVIIQSISFHELGRHVRQMPQGDDRLDLTRFVEYAMRHPEEGLQFPQDFDILAQKLGTAQVSPRHLDAAAAARWSQRRAIVQQPQTALPHPQIVASQVVGSLAQQPQPAVSAPITGISSVDDSREAENQEPGKYL